MKRSVIRQPDLSSYLGIYTDGPSVVSDHVVFGENLDAYADPSVGARAGSRQPTGPALVEGGATDVRFPWSLSADPDYAVETLSAHVAVFPDATR